MTDDKISEDYWNINIQPRHSAFVFNVKELWKYRDLILLMVKRDFTARYKQTVLGPIWHVIQPALSTIMSVLLFNVLAKLTTDGKNPLLFQMSGIIIWNYFAACLTNTSNTFTANAGIFGKVYFPRMAMPISVVISNLIQLSIQLGLLIATLLFFVFFRNLALHISWTWLLIPPVILIMAGIGLGLGIIISSLTTRYRDLTVLVTFGVQLLMFGSAVNYSLTQFSNTTKTGEILHILVRWNPISTLVETFRNALLGGDIHYAMICYTLVLMILILVYGILSFNKVEKTFMDTV